MQESVKQKIERMKKKSRKLTRQGKIVEAGRLFRQGWLLEHDLMEIKRCEE